MFLSDYTKDLCRRVLQDVPPALASSSLWKHLQSRGIEVVFGEDMLKTAIAGTAIYNFTVAHLGPLLYKHSPGFYTYELAFLCFYAEVLTCVAHEILRLQPERQYVALSVANIRCHVIVRTRRQANLQICCAEIARMIADDSTDNYIRTLLTTDLLALRTCLDMQPVLGMQAVALRIEACHSEIY